MELPQDQKARIIEEERQRMAEAECRLQARRMLRGRRRLSRALPTRGFGETILVFVLGILLVACSAVLLPANFH